MKKMPYGIFFVLFAGNGVPVVPAFLGFVKGCWRNILVKGEIIQILRIRV
jgi:hypothetical protein